MTTTAYVKIPLEERLQRLAAGLASSPQFSRKTINTFCATPVIYALESVGAFEERAMLCKLLSSKPVTQYFGSCATHLVTLGDIAEIITEVYLKPEVYRKYSKEDTDEKAHNNMICDGECFISLYFFCFDVMLCLRKRVTRYDRPFRRSDVNPYLQSVYDFLHISLSDYYACVKQYCLENHLRRIESYRVARGISDIMTPIALYDEIKQEACNSDNFLFGILENERLTYTQCKYLIDFFVYPIAKIHEKEKLQHDDKFNEQN